MHLNCTVHILDPCLINFGTRRVRIAEMIKSEYVMRRVVCHAVEMAKTADPK